MHLISSSCCRTTAVNERGTAAHWPRRRDILRRSSAFDPLMQTWGKKWGRVGAQTDGLTTIQKRNTYFLFFKRSIQSILFEWPALFSFFTVNLVLIFLLKTEHIFVFLFFNIALKLILISNLRRSVTLLWNTELCLRGWDGNHPDAGQRFHKKGPYVGGSVSDFTWCAVLITSGSRALCHPPSPPRPLPQPPPLTHTPLPVYPASCWLLRGADWSPVCSRDS